MRKNHLMLPFVSKAWSVTNGEREGHLNRAAAIRPDIRDVILCPLCVRPFGRSALDSRELTEEHIVAERLGGKIVTLTCKRCNNDDGGQVDSHFVQKVTVGEALRGYPGSICSDVFISGHRMLAQVELPQGEGGQGKIVGQRKGSNYAEIEAIQEALLQGVKKIHIKMNFRYKPKLAKLALVRSAYLAMFCRYGYRYILNDSVEYIRQLIRRRDLSNELLEFMLIENIQVEQDIQHPLHFFHIALSTGMLFYLVLIRLSLNSISYHGVIMPDTIPNAINIYQELHILRERGISLSINI